MDRVAHFLRVKVADGAPDFIALRVKKYKSGGEVEVVHGGEFHACLFLNVQANDVDLVAKFCLELVNDGLNGCAANSVGRLKFKQNGRACPNHRFDFLGVFHERGLARVQDAPCGEKPQNDNAKGEVVIPFGFICKQDETRHQTKADSNGNEGILVGN